MNSRGFKDRRMEKTIGAFMAEKRAEKYHKNLVTRLEKSCDARIKDIDTQTGLLERELSIYRRGTTSVRNYFQKKQDAHDANTITFPFERNLDELKPQPCWLDSPRYGSFGPSTLTTHQSDRDTRQCSYFPCRKLTSYNFMFREFPEFVTDYAEERAHALKRGQPNAPSREQTFGTSLKENVTSHPPENMTDKEWKLKLCIQKKREHNAKVNKPKDRNVNYGEPTPVRQLQRALRPVVRQMDTL